MDEEPMIEPDPDDYAPTLDEIIRKALVEGKSIFCETEAVSDFIKLTIPELVCSYDATDFRIYDLLIFSMDYILRKPTKETSELYWVNL
jgi:hypothetical protein